MKPQNLKNLICIAVNNSSGYRLPFSIIFVENVVKKLLQQYKIRDADISVSFVSDQAIRRLNVKYLDKKRATDVLAFNMSSRNGCLVADIIVSVDTARVVSKELEVPLAQELCRYLIHGMLHLLGYDDHTAAEKKRMWKKQETFLEENFRLAVSG